MEVDKIEIFVLEDWKGENVKPGGRNVYGV